MERWFIPQNKNEVPFATLGLILCVNVLFTFKLDRARLKSSDNLASRKREEKGGKGKWN